MLFAAGLAAGLAWAFGPLAATVAVFATASYLFVGDTAQSPGKGAATAGLLLAGGLIATAVNLIPARGPRFAPQRAALAAVYHELAQRADLLSHDPERSFSSQTFVHGWQTVPLLPAKPAAAPLHALLSEAELLRSSLLSVAEVEHTPPLLRAAGTVLHKISRALAAGQPAVVEPHCWTELEDHIPADPAGRAVAGRLLSRLRKAAALAGPHPDQADPGMSGGQDMAVPSGPPKPWADRFSPVLHPHMTTTYPVLRHALRLGAAMAAGELAGRWLASWDGMGLPGHAFWIPLTELRPRVLLDHSVDGLRRHRPRL